MGLPDKPERDIFLCERCGFRCPHVEAMGIYFCPNCGDPQPVPGVPGKVTYKFGQGCPDCGLPGHEPLPGYMDPYPKGHARVALGLAPVVKNAWDRIRTPKGDF